MLQMQSIVRRWDISFRPIGAMHLLVLIVVSIKRLACELINVHRFASQLLLCDLISTTEDANN